jgi:hypothetical protein
MDCCIIESNVVLTCILVYINPLTAMNGARGYERIARLFPKDT